MKLYILLTFTFFYGSLFKLHGVCMSPANSFSLSNAAHLNSALIFSPIDSNVALATNNQVAIYNVSSDAFNLCSSQPINNVDPTQPFYLAFSSKGNLLGGNLLAVTSGTTIVTLFSVTSAGILSAGTPYSLPPGFTSAQSVAFSPQGDYLAIVAIDSQSDAHQKNITIFKVTTNGTLTFNANYPLPSNYTSTTLIAFSPDWPDSPYGNVLAAMNYDSNSIIIFPINPDGTLGTYTNWHLPKMSTAPKALAFSPDGKYLSIVNSDSNDVVIFKLDTIDIETQVPIVKRFELPLGATFPNSIVFSPNNKYLATANYGSGNITIFPITSGILGDGVNYSISGQLASSVSIAFSPNNNYIITSSIGSSSIITIFTMAGLLGAGNVYPLPSGSSNPTSITLTSDAKVFTANFLTPNGVGDVSAYNLQSGTLSNPHSLSFYNCLPLLKGQINPYSITSFDNYIATANFESNSVSIFKPDGACSSSFLPTNSNGPKAAACNGSYLVTANKSNDVTLFSFSNGRLSAGQSFNLPSNSFGPSAISFSPSGLYVFVADSESNDITAFSLQSNHLIAPLATSLPKASCFPTSIAVAPNGKYLVTSNLQSNDITVFSLSGKTLSNPISYPLPSGSAGPRSVKFSPNGSYLLTANQSSNDLTIFTVTNGVLSCGTSFPLSDGCMDPWAAVFSPDGSTIATANYASNNVGIYAFGN